MALSRSQKIHLKAHKYLERIAEVTGALINLGSFWEDLVRYDTAEYEFWISPHQITRVDKVTRKTTHTCWKPPQKVMPYTEAIASVLLLLHDDPTIFEEWRRQARGSA